MSLSVDKVLHKAQSRIKAGNLTEAEELYKQVLSKFPKNKKAIQGYQRLKAGVSSKASSKSEPPQEQVDELFGLYEQGQFEEVISKVATLISLFPKAMTLYNIQGASNAVLQKHDTAINCFKQVLKIQPDYADALNNIGFSLREKGELDAAIDSFKQALKIKPGYADAYCNMGNALTDKGNLNAAIDNYQQALKIKPEYAVAYYNMGNALKDKGELDAAIDSYQQALKIKPDYAHAYNNMGNALKDKGNLNAAIDNYQQALKIKPDYADAYYNMGNALKDGGDLNVAIDSYQQALKIKPDYADAYYNMGVVFSEYGESESAIQNCDKAIEIDPNYQKSKFLKAKLLLNRHEFETGWPLFIANRDPVKEPTLAASERAERWKGSCLKGKNIQVYAAQGVGDELFYSSCIPDLIRKCPRGIYLECDPRLQALFSRSFPEIVVYGKARTSQLDNVFKSDDAPTKNYRLDYSVPIDELLYFFRKQIEDFPVRNSFLTPDSKLVKKWVQRLERLGTRKKIGISWLGGSKTIRDQNSIPLQYWKSLLSVDACFINLQYGDTSEEIAQFSAENNIKIYDWKDNNASMDLDNQAALISELDLVISIDNATVQSCVALGTEVWDLFIPSLNFLWMENGTNASPLCPHLRLFKKTHKNTWPSVLIHVEEQLRQKIG